MVSVAVVAVMVMLSAVMTALLMEMLVEPWAILKGSGPSRGWTYAWVEASAVKSPSMSMVAVAAVPVPPISMSGALRVTSSNPEIVDPAPIVSESDAATFRLAPFSPLTSDFVANSA